MLSFDITDRNIRIVKGQESNGKLKIHAAVTVNVDEGLIVNGHVRDVPSIAQLIHQILMTRKMTGKEAIVSISSNLTIFKEMTVLKSKGQDLQKTVKLQMQSELNLDDSYSVSYIVVGDADTGTGEPAYKILATACPYEIVNSYREVFKLLSIPLKSVMIGCNCITKVLLADQKIKSKMPLLAVQIDNNFISLNLYENGQLSFSRFASIDAADYGYSDDYVFEAVNENIFRMLQFHRSRNTGAIIENVVFYGDTHEYVRLTDELEKLDLKTSLINVPAMIHGHENLEFSLYANAIGAMFKRNKETEKINLLETDLGTTIKNKVKDDSAGNVAIVAALIGSIVLGGGGYLVQMLRNNSVLNDIEEVEEFINSEDTKGKLRQQTRLLHIRETVEAYHESMSNCRDAFMSLPAVDGEAYDMLQEVLFKTSQEIIDGDKVIDDAAEEMTANPDSIDPRNSYNYQIHKPKYEDGLLTFEVYCPAINEQFAQKIPADYAIALQKNCDGKYMAVGYEGYTVSDIVRQDNKDISDRMLTFDVVVQLSSVESAYHPEQEETNEEAE